MDYLHQSEDKIREASETVNQTVQRAADNRAARLAADVSETGERGLAAEPVNTTMRSMLLAGAGLAVATSAMLQLTGRKHESLFLGQWAPTLISIALWYQIVKGQQRHLFR
jgi:hypothetical protein